MGVRVKLRICIRDNCITTKALVNSGYESEGPELAMPVELAKELNIWPPTEFILEEAYTAGGLTQIYIIKEKARVNLVLDNKYVEDVETRLVINPYLDEVLISDQLIDALGIIVISYGRGLWRHKSDPENRVRESIR